MIKLSAAEIIQATGGAALGLQDPRRSSVPSPLLIHGK